jgi:hypothetical protein
VNRNIVAAFKLYYNRLNYLNEQLHTVVMTGISGLAEGTCTEEQVIRNLDDINEEVSRIEECLRVLKHLGSGR